MQSSTLDLPAAAVPASEAIDRARRGGIAARWPGRLLLALSLFALLFGSYLARCFQRYQPAFAAPEWNRAAWIRPAAAAPLAYYRASISLAAVPRHAYLQIAAPDSFTAYVNGEAVGGASFTSANTFDRMDIAGALQPGRNLIAVRVARNTYPGSADLRARAVWRDDAGNHGELGSSPAWRVAQRQEYQPERQLEWYAPEFDDAAWPYATLQERPQPGLLPAHPWAAAALFTGLRRGERISAGAARSTGVSFRRDFTLDDERLDHAWLDIAADGPYTLTINRTPLRSAPATGTAMDAYDIGPYLAAGANSVEIELSTLDTEAGLSVSAEVVTASGARLDLSSNPDWRMRGDAAEPWQAVIGHGEQPPVQPLPMHLVDVPVPASVALQSLLHTLSWIAGVLLLAGGAIALATARGDLDRSAARAALAAPALFAALLLAGAFLLSFDVRLDAQRIFHVRYAIALAVVTLLWSGRILRELRHARA